MKTFDEIFVIFAAAKTPRSNEVAPVKDLFVFANYLAVQSAASK